MFCNPFLFLLHSHNTSLHQPYRSFSLTQVFHCSFPLLYEYFLLFSFSTFLFLSHQPPPYRLLSRFATSLTVTMIIPSQLCLRYLPRTIPMTQPRIQYCVEPRYKSHSILPNTQPSISVMYFIVFITALIYACQ